VLRLGLSGFGANCGVGNVHGGAGAEPVGFKQRSAHGETVSIVGFDGEAGCGHGGEALVAQGGGADAT
jgi:hypothetical protein